MTTQTGIPASGMWGCPEDYPADFVAIDDLALKIINEAGDSFRREGTAYSARYRVLRAEFNERSAAVTALIDLAHDLDARGLVVVPEVATREMMQAGDGACCLIASYRDTKDVVGEFGLAYAAMTSAGSLEFPPLPPDPNTGS